MWNFGREAPQGTITFKSEGPGPNFRFLDSDVNFTGSSSLVMVGTGVITPGAGGIVSVNTLVFSAPNGTGAGVAGKGFTFTTGTSGGATAAGGDFTLNLGSEAGVARAGRQIINRTSVQTDGGNYNGALTINETLTPATTVTGSTQAINILYTMNGDASAYTDGAGNAGISPIESQFICNLTGTLATLLYGAEFQFIMQGTGSANATVVQADMYGLAPSPGTMSNFVGYRAILGPLNGVTATVATAFQSQSGGFATRNSITANNTLTVRNFLSNILIGSPSGTDTTGGYAISGFVSGVPSQGGNTSGTNDNRGVSIVVTTPSSTGGSPGVNGTVNNSAGWFGVPTAAGPGSGTGRTVNVGVFINGNGNAGTQGVGFVNDWALFSNSTAPSGLAGSFYVGTPGPFNPPATSSTLQVLASKTVVSGAGATWKGISFTAATATLSGTTNITTATGFNLIEVAAPTISWATANSVLRSATLAILGPPVGAGAGPASLTNAYSLDVQTGNVFLGGLITSYNNIAVGGNGIGSLVKYNRPAQQVNSTVTLATYATPASDGSYRVWCNVNVTVSTTVTMTVTVAYTDEANVARTLTVPFFLLAGTLVQSITTAQGNIAYESLPITIRTKASTSITIATAGTVTAVTYTGEGFIEQVA